MIGLVVTLLAQGAPDPARYYPEKAQIAHVEGSATIDCAVNAASTLEDCRVVSETPEGWGFGVAALKMSGLFKMRPIGPDGHPGAGGGRVKIPLKFSLPHDAPVPPPATGP